MYISKQLSSIKYEILMLDIYKKILEKLIRYRFFIYVRIEIYTDHKSNI